MLAQIQRARKGHSTASRDRSARIGREKKKTRPGPLVLLPCQPQAGGAEAYLVPAKTKLSRSRERRKKEKEGPHPLARAPKEKKKRRIGFAIGKVEFFPKKRRKRGRDVAFPLGRKKEEKGQISTSVWSERKNRGKKGKASLV